MKRLLVTGAKGFTGVHLARAAAAAGYEVLPLQADLLDAKALVDEIAAADPDRVVHLAAISAVTHQDASALYQVNTVGSCNLLEALAKLPRTDLKVVLASSANVYGNALVSPLNESSPPAPVNHYACSKLAMEHMAQTFANRFSVVIARPFNYTGPGHDVRFVLPKLVRAFAEHADFVELGNVNVQREFNDVRFVVAAYMTLLERGVSGETYNVCTGIGHSLSSVIDELSKLSGHTLRVVVNPAFVRANEVFRLTGDPAKLSGLGAVTAGYSLTELLRWMLSEFSS